MISMRSRRSCERHTAPVVLVLDSARRIGEYPAPRTGMEAARAVTEFGPVLVVLAVGVGLVLVC